MLVELQSETLSALQLIRTGRFSDALLLLQQPSRARRNNSLTLALLADILQRVGHNDQAADVAARALKTASDPQVVARCHFALGNVHRDRGDTAQALDHLQIAAGATLSPSDLELSCWTQLRLMAVVAEMNGARAAMARLDGVKRALTRFGDPRPFAALHLWLVEIESMRGNLESALQHRTTAASLLSTAEDVWLRGYLAINSSVLYYYLAEIIEARNWAAIAIDCARTSGHKSTLRSAHANLGSIEFSLGNYQHAEHCFQIALECCERGTVPHIAILDNIAQIRLHRGDLAGCRTLVTQLDNLVAHDTHDKRRHYSACATQTKIKLLISEGKTVEAVQVSQDILSALKGALRPRIASETHLLNAEALLCNGQLSAAVNALTEAFLGIGSLSPELSAKFERVAGRALSSCGAFDLARLRLERAAHTFNAIGHSIGSDLTTRELNGLPRFDVDSGPSVANGTQRSFDRIRALVDQRARPELFGLEAVSLLKELGCASTMDLSVRERTEPVSRERHCENTLSISPITISIGNTSRGDVILSFVPREDARSKLTALSFYRVIKQLLANRCEEDTLAGQEIVWTASEGCTKQGAIFGSESMIAILKTIRQVAPTDVSVLITGETGTGKEIIAKTVHEFSRREALPFLALNCAAVPKELLESQLFGHRKGAFSGAAESHLGIVRAANGGTLFLDEVGDIPFDMQAKLLRFLEMGEVHPVGENHPIKVDVRLIFATNGDLEEAVNQNRFRQDLYYRLNVVPVKVPPLRERRDEIPVLAYLFAQRFAAEFEKEALQFSSRAMELLIMYSWPGNIRQLANEIRRLSALMDSGSCVAPEHLSPQLQLHKPSLQIDGTDDARQMRIGIDQTLEKATAELEAEMITRALRQADGRVSEAAAALGISRKGLYLKRQRLGLTNSSARAH